MVYIGPISGKLICNECDEEWEFSINQKSHGKFVPYMFLEQVNNEAIKSNEEANHHAYCDDCAGRVVLHKIDEIRGMVRCDEVNCKSQDTFAIKNNAPETGEIELFFDVICNAIAGDLTKVDAPVPIKWDVAAEYVECCHCIDREIEESCKEMQHDLRVLR